MKPRDMQSPYWQRLKQFFLYEEWVDGHALDTDWRPVRRAQLELFLQKFSLGSSVVAALSAAEVWGLFFWLWPSVSILAWAVLVHGAQCLRYVQTKRLLARGPISDAQLPGVLRRQTQYLWLLGSAWGLAPWLVMAKGNTSSMAIMSVFIVSMVSSAGAVLSSHRQTVVAFSVPTAIGLIMALAWSGGVIGWVMALAVAQYAVMGFRWTFQQVDLLVEALRARFENEDLAHQLALQIERVRASDREKTRFLASASHDLRQPLHAVSLLTAALEHSVLPPLQHATVQRLGHSVRMLCLSLNSMLDVSRLDGGVVQPEIAAISVHQIFLALQQTYGVSAEEKGLELRIRAPKDIYVWSDALLLERLLGNLIDNAIKYTKRGAVLLIARVPRGSQAGHPIVRFMVIDTGVGVGIEHQQRIFDEFYQIDNPERDRSRGLGLGLAIAKRLAYLLVHPIAVQSWLGQGSRFIVNVPYAPAPTEPEIPALDKENAPERPFHLPAHVLVLDDEIDGATALSGLLQLHGVQVTVVGNVDAARRILEAGTVHAVVSDFRLPGPINGLEFLLETQRSWPLLPSLLITGETAPEQIQAIQSSALPCIFKPVQEDQLLIALRSHDSLGGSFKA